MPEWLVILLLFELVILLTNPNERDYAWLQGPRRPVWLTFHIWRPLIPLARNLGIDLLTIWVSLISRDSVNRPVSTFRSFVKEVKRLNQSLTPDLGHAEAAPP
jgi:hypothetical protein